MYLLLHKNIKINRLNLIFNLMNHYRFTSTKLHFKPSIAIEPTILKSMNEFLNFRNVSFMKNIDDQCGIDNYVPMYCTEINENESLNHFNENSSNLKELVDECMSIYLAFSDVMQGHIVPPEINDKIDYSSYSKFETLLPCFDFNTAMKNLLKWKLIEKNTADEKVILPDKIIENKTLNVNDDIKDFSLQHVDSCLISHKSIHKPETTLYPFDDIITELKSNKVINTIKENKNDLYTKNSFEMFKDIYLLHPILIKSIEKLYNTKKYHPFQFACNKDTIIKCNVIDISSINHLTSSNTGNYDTTNVYITIRLTLVVPVERIAVSQCNNYYYYFDRNKELYEKFINDKEVKDNSYNKINKSNISADARTEKNFAFFLGSLPKFFQNFTKLTDYFAIKKANKNKSEPNKYDFSLFLESSQLPKPWKNIKDGYFTTNKEIKLVKTFRNVPMTKEKFYKNIQDPSVQLFKSNLNDEEDKSILYNWRLIGVQSSNFNFESNLYDVDS